jgi:hypothetical protein
VPPAVSGGAEIDLGELDACPTANCVSAGIKQLLFGDLAIAMDDGPMLLDVPFAGAIASYLVDNLTSFVDDDCREQVAWTGQLVP